MGRTARMLPWAVLLVAACRPDSYGHAYGRRVLVPASELSPSMGRPQVELAVPPQGTVRVWQPDPRVRVLVPVGQALPRGMKTLGRGQLDP